MVKENTKTTYHHGDLHQKLLDEATLMIEGSGVEGLSLRKLANRVGVSRTAPYHHFKDKNELICAIAEEGYLQYLARAQASFDDETVSLREKFRSYVYGYVKFAHDNPELYELMFGRAIWKQQNSTQGLRDAAYPCFQHQLEMTAFWQKNGLLNNDESALRLSQVIWGTLHGIAKLLIDGIYTHTSQVEEMCDCAVNLFTNSN
ncbi:MAG: TetR/AcrR family transcriptional regulator [Gammaproteobacteria bacterium]|nr:TetR/AcrR family transcriptional regulator [Gammaproteobacteria bacterium]